MSDFINKTFKWNYTDYSGRMWSWYREIAIERPLYLSFVNRSHEVHSSEDYIRFVTQQDDEAFFQRLAQKLIQSAMKAGYSRLEMAEWVLNMVASIPYARDPGGEYPRYPIETLWDGSGDCDDSAILVAKLWRAMGFDVALILLPRHMAVAIHIPDTFVRGVYWTNSYGKKYYYAEAAGSYFAPSQRRIGHMPDKYRNLRATFLPIPPIENNKNTSPTLSKPDSLRRFAPKPEPEPSPSPPPSPDISDLDKEGSVVSGLGFFLLLILLILIGWKYHTTIRNVFHRLPSVATTRRAQGFSSKHTPQSLRMTPAKSITPQNAWINTGRLNVRLGPGVNYPVQTSLPNGTQVQVIGFSDDQEWSYIKTPKEGWVRNKYLRYQSATPTTASSREKYQVTASRGLNVREGPGSNYKVIGKLNFNTKVIVDRFNADRTWAHILAPQKGWVYAEYLSSEISGSPSKSSKSLCIYGRRERFDKQPSPLNEIWGQILDRNGRPFTRVGVEVYVPHYEDRFRVSVPVQQDGSFYLSALTPTNEYGVRLVDAPYPTKPVTFWYPNKAPYQKAIIIFEVQPCQ